MEDQIQQYGPKDVVIPEIRYLSCHGCKFHEHKMVKSGFNPIYAHFCNNPHISDENKFGFLSRGNLPSEDKTPDWCPYQNIGVA
jgi:hypothetical protein